MADSWICRVSLWVMSLPSINMFKAIRSSPASPPIPANVLDTALTAGLLTFALHVESRISSALGDYESADLYPYGVGISLVGPVLRDRGTPEQQDRIMLMRRERDIPAVEQCPPHFVCMIAARCGVQPLKKTRGGIGAAVLWPRLRRRNGRRHVEAAGAAADPATARRRARRRRRRT